MSARASTVVMPAAMSFSRMASPSSETCSMGVLLLFALDVDLPLEELGGEADVLALFADG
jgi:hypothetical protein